MKKEKKVSFLLPFHPIVACAEQSTPRSVAFAERQLLKTQTPRLSSSVTKSAIFCRGDYWGLVLDKNICLISTENSEMNDGFIDLDSLYIVFIPGLLEETYIVCEPLYLWLNC